MARFPFIIIKLFLCFFWPFFLFSSLFPYGNPSAFSHFICRPIRAAFYTSVQFISAYKRQYTKIFHFSLFPFDIALYVHLASCIGIVHLVPLGKAVARHSILLSSHRLLHTRFHFSLTQPVPIFPMAFRILFKIHLSLPCSMHTVWYFSFHL